MRTEVATIGVRGTEFWGGLLDGVHQFALLSGNAIIVENKAGRVEMSLVRASPIALDAARPVLTLPGPLVLEVAP
jgi:hypothetical protein